MSLVGTMMATLWLQVTPPPAVQSGGPYLPAKLERALRADTALGDDHISVVIERGSIVLRGTVDDPRERKLAEAIVADHKPARMSIDNRLTLEGGAAAGARAALIELEALARLGRARSHAPEIRTLADRVLADAQLALARVAPGGAPPRAPAGQVAVALDELTGQRFNRAYVLRLERQLTAALVALDEVAAKEPLEALESTRRELKRDRDQAAGLRQLYQAPPRPPTR